MHRNMAHLMRSSYIILSVYTASTGLAYDGVQEKMTITAVTALILVLIQKFQCLVAYSAKAPPTMGPTSLGSANDAHECRTALRLNSVVNDDEGFHTERLQHLQQNGPQ